MTIDMADILAHPPDPWPRPLSASGKKTAKVGGLGWSTHLIRKNNLSDKVDHSPWVIFTKGPDHPLYRLSNFSG